MVLKVFTLVVYSEFGSATQENYLAVLHAYRFQPYFSLSDQTEMGQSEETLRSVCKMADHENTNEHPGP